MMSAIFKSTQHWSDSPKFTMIKNFVFLYFVSTKLLQFVSNIISNGPLNSIKSFWLSLHSYLIKGLIVLPFTSRKIQKKVDKNIKEIENAAQFYKPEDHLTELNNLPLSDQSIIDSLNSLAENASSYKEGQLSGTIYDNLDEMVPILKKILRNYGLTNPLHPDVFPGLNKLEKEILSMTLNLYNASEVDGIACFTSGGTESILLACKAYRDYAKIKRNIVYPEMVVPITAHAAFDKACQLFNIKIRHIAVDETYKVDLNKLKSAINSNTIMIVGSAVNFPYGIMDDIETLSMIAQKKDIPLHVDCCLGGFLMPFMEEAGFNTPKFDFRLKGVTSISCDYHKYGLTLKGASTIMYSHKKYIHHQYSVVSDWTGGIYATHTLPGSKPGFLIAATWAALMKRGKHTYIKNTKNIVECTKYIRNKIKEEIKQLRVLGDPKVCVVAFESLDNDINVLSLCDAMHELGWCLNKLQNPSAAHIACTVLTCEKKEKFISDLKECLIIVKANKEKYNTGLTAFYGAKGSLAKTSVTNTLIHAYLDALVKI